MIKDKIKQISEEIKQISKKDICLMEVCGTHTMSIARHGIRSLLPSNIRIISGPGCPVCVTPSGEIETAINLAKDDRFIIATFGDMLKVPGKSASLQDYKNVKIIYNPLESLKLAEDNPLKQVVLLGIGFETTSPLIASTIKTAHKMSINNFSVFCMHKTVPSAINLIIDSDKDRNISGLILPGHVSAITGRRYFDFIKDKKISGVICGFEALEIMQTIYILIRTFELNETIVINNYKTVVSEEGNLTAKKAVFDVFDMCDSEWRGIGLIKDSGLKIKAKYKEYDAVIKFGLKVVSLPDPAGCRCGDILMAKAIPNECKYFGKECTPSNPIGPCMVSSEGTCAAFYKY
ncbi:MAG: hydrogenase formation protein HypD, partial [bacterium]